MKIEEIPSWNRVKIEPKTNSGVGLDSQKKGLYHIWHNPLKNL